MTRPRASCCHADPLGHDVATGASMHMHVTILALLLSLAPRAAHPCQYTDPWPPLNTSIGLDFPKQHTFVFVIGAL